MKKRLFALLSLLCSMTAAWAEGLNLPVNAEGYLEVRTAEELVAAIRADNGAKIKLETDSINIGGIGRICETFTGTIVGSHEITIPETGERRIAPSILAGQLGLGKGADSYLFENVVGAHFEYVAFMNFRVEDDDNNNLGVVARSAISTIFSNVSAIGVSVFCNHDNAGAIVGTAQNCTFEVVRVIASSVTTDGIGAGGIAGSSSACQFTSCGTNVHTHVFADGRQGAFFTTNAACAGGISGYSSLDHFYNCVNYGWVGGDEDQVGGIVGTSMGSQFNLCTNAGVVLQASEENFIKVIEGSLYKTIDYSSWKYQAESLWVMLGIGAFSADIGVGGWFVFLSGDLLGTIGGAMVVVGFVGIATVVITGMLMSAHDELGGIVGHAEGGSFEQCANEGYYNAVDEECGGIVGKGSSLTINNCYSVRKPGGIDHIKDVKKLETNAAIIGSADGCLITNNYAICKYRAIGKAENMNSASGNNYYVSDTEVTEVSAYEMRATTEQMQSGQLAYWLNNLHHDAASPAGPWRQNLTGEKDDHPILDPTHGTVTVADITTIAHITDAAGLEAFAQRVNDGDLFANAVLDDDISLSGSWTPIGNSQNRYRGIFDGQGHTISGLTVNMASDEVGAGLFGVVHNNAIIRDVTVDGSCSVTNTKDGGAAGIVGLMNTGWNWSEVLIENCASYASVTANKHAGGILGRVITTDADGGPSVRVYVDNCYSMGTITATNGNSALLCGYVKQHGHISNCWSAGSLKTTDLAKYPFSIVNPKNEYEYLAGYDEKIDIKNCYILGSADNIDRYDAAKMQSGVTAYSTRSVSKEYGTVCLPYALKSDDAISYYTFTESTGSGSDVDLKFEYAETVAPGTPALFKVAAPGEIVFNCAGTGSADSPVAPDAAADWKFTGTYEKCTFSGEDLNTKYYVSNGAIKHSTNTLTIEANRAYFEGPSIDVLTGNGLQKASIRTVIDGVEGEATALELISEDLVSGQNGKSYTIYGTEAGEGYHGIVIRSGKKVLR